MLKFAVVGSVAAFAQAERILTSGMVETVKSNTSLWTPYEPEENPFLHHSIDEMVGMLGTIIHDDERMNTPQPVIGGVPSAYDWRQTMPNCIHPIRNQGGCGSCWAFGATEAFSDRICIATKGRVNVVLSPQDLLACAPTGSCKGGAAGNAFAYFKTNGVLSDDCLPYVSGTSHSEGTCPSKCQNGAPMKRYKCKDQIVAKGPAEIKATILQSGPVESAFGVYGDFFTYKTGIYHHVTGDHVGGHAVKTVGWGSEGGVNYWIAANSWGPKWGDNGFFKIKEGECGFDATAWACNVDTASTVSEDFFLQ